MFRSEACGCPWWLNWWPVVRICLLGLLCSQRAFLKSWKRYWFTKSFLSLFAAASHSQMCLSVCRWKGRRRNTSKATSGRGRETSTSSGNRECLRSRLLLRYLWILPISNRHQTQMGLGLRESLVLIWRCLLWRCLWSTGISFSHISCYQLSKWWQFLI